MESQFCVERTSDFPYQQLNSDESVSLQTSTTVTHLADYDTDAMVQNNLRGTHEMIAVLRAKGFISQTSEFWMPQATTSLGFSAAKTYDAGATKPLSFLDLIHRGSRRVCCC